MLLKFFWSSVLINVLIIIPKSLVPYGYLLSKELSDSVLSTTW